MTRFRPTGPGISERPRLSRRALLSGAAALGAHGVLPRRLAAQPAATALADPQILARAVEKARGLDQMHSLIVARAGTVLFEEAFRGAALDVPANIKSVSKTVVAALVGIAIDRGILPGVDAHIAPILGSRVPSSADPRVHDITIEHLLTMRSGLDRTSGANYGQWVQSSNWVSYILTRPFRDEPGGRMLYSTGNYHLLSALLTEASGHSTLALARSWLGTPLGIEIPPWTRDPQGIYLGGNNMALSPHAMLRFGEMARLGGTYHDLQVLGADWIARSWVPRTRSPFSGDQYGYGWFIAEAGGRRLYYARGYGGQMIFLVPELELSVVVTSDPNRPARSDGYVGDLRALLADDIIPAAEVA